MVALKSILPVTAVLLSFTMAQSDALASIKALISYEDAAISSLSAAVATNPLYTGYSSQFAKYTSEWAQATQELAGVTAAIVNNPAESSIVASYVSRVGPLLSSITAHAFTLPTDSAGVSSAYASASRELQSISQEIAGTAAAATNAAASSAAASSSTTSGSSPASSANAAPKSVGVQFDLMGAASVGVFALAICL